MDDQGVVWRNGELVPFADATVHVLSHMAARGSQVFDVMLVTATEAGLCAVGLRQHVTRFLRSAEMMGMGDLGRIGDIEQAIARTVMANVGPGFGQPGVDQPTADQPTADQSGADQSGADQPSADRSGAGRPITVKMIAGWAEEAKGLMPSQWQPTVYVLALPAGVDQSSAVLKPAVTVRSADMPKVPAEILPPSLKVAAGYTPGFREQLRSQSLGFDHTVFKTTAGDLAESTTLSMLVVHGDRIIAPPLDNVLDGITRRVLLDAAQDGGTPVEVRSIRWDEVRSADELLLTSTNNPVIPVSRLDDVELAAPGPVTAEVAAAVSDLLAGNHQLSERWLTPLEGLA